MTLVVSSADVIRAAPGQLSFSYQAGASAPAATTIQVTGSSSALPIQINATTDAGGPWLQVSGEGTTPLTMSVSINPAGLLPGTYTGTISLASEGAGNSPLLVPITLTVSTEAVLTAVPVSVQFTAPVNGPPTSTQIVSIRTGGSQIPVTYSVSPNAGWLTHNGSATAPGNLTLSASPAGLALDATLPWCW